MTVNTTIITSGPYTGNGVTTGFAYNFRVNDKSQLSVYETTDAGVETLLTVDTDYTVAGVGVDGGGTVTRVAGALPSGYTWYIRSNYIENQLTEFSSQGGFFPEVHEAQMDHLTFLVQQLRDSIARSLKLDDGYGGTLGLTLPSPAVGEFLRWKSDLSGMENVELASGLTIANDQLLIFDSVAAMKASTSTDIAEGVLILTRGYAQNGVGAGVYIVTSSVSVDGYVDHALAGGLFAVLITDGSATLEQFGAIGDGIVDDYASINAAFSGRIKTLFGTQTAVYRHDTHFRLGVAQSNLILDFRGATCKPTGAGVLNCIYIPAVGDGRDSVAGAVNTKISNLNTDGTNAAAASAIGIVSYNANGLYLDNIQNDNYSLSGTVLYGLVAGAVVANLSNIRGTGNTNHALAVATMEEDKSRIIIDGVHAWSNGLGVDASSGSASYSNINTWSNTNGGMKIAGNDDAHVSINGLHSVADGQGFYTNGTYRLLELDGIDVLDSVSHGVALNHAGTTLVGSVNVENAGDQGFYQFGASDTLAASIHVNNSGGRGLLITDGNFQCANVKTENSGRRGVETVTTGSVHINSIISVDDCSVSDSQAVILSPTVSGDYTIDSIQAIDTRGTPKVTIALSVGANVVDAAFGSIRKTSNITTAISDSGTDTRYADADGHSAIANDRLGVFSTPPVVKQTVAGAKGGNAALTSLLSALAAYGLVIDSTT